MSYSLIKKVGVRMARCEAELLKLRLACTDGADAKRMDRAIAVFREAGGRMNDAFLDIAADDVPAAPAPAAAIAQPAKAAPAGKPPVYGPATGVYQAPAEGMKGTAAQIIESENDVMHMARRGDAATEVAEILAGNLGTAYECDAAKILAGNPAWEFWTPEERLAAIEDKGRQLEDADDTDYFADTTAAPAAGDAAAV